MSRLRWLRLPWLFNRTVGMSLLWMAVLVGVAVLVNVAGIHAIGDVEAWTVWLQQHASYFFVWRLGLYAVAAYGWWWMRCRVRQRESTADSHQHLARVEVAAVATVVFLEGSQLLLHR